MLAQFIYDAAPLGSLVRFSNGEPRPPKHFRRKVRAWNDANGFGRLTERTPAQIGATYQSPASFTLHLGNYGSQGIVVLVMNRTFPMTSTLQFDVVEVPKPGAVRILTRFNNRDALRFLAPDMVTAEEWMATHRYSDMRAEIVPDPDLVLLPADISRAA